MDPRALGEVSFHEGFRTTGPNRAVGHRGVFLNKTPFRIKTRNGVFIFWTNVSGGFWGTTHLGVRRFSRLFPGRLLPGWLLPGRLLPLFPGRGFHVFPGWFPRSFPEDDSRSSFRHGAPRLSLPPPSHSAVICGHPRGRRRRYGGCDVRAECRCQELHWPHSG